MPSPPRRSFWRGDLCSSFTFYLGARQQPCQRATSNLLPARALLPPPSRVALLLLPFSLLPPPPPPLPSPFFLFARKLFLAIARSICISSRTRGSVAVVSRVREFSFMYVCVCICVNRFIYTLESTGKRTRMTIYFFLADAVAMKRKRFVECTAGMDGFFRWSISRHGLLGFSSSRCDYCRMRKVIGWFEWRRSRASVEMYIASRNYNFDSELLYILELSMNLSINVYLYQ